MPAILYVIWEFLVAAWPTIVAIGATIGEIYAVLKSIAATAALLALFVGIVEILFDPRGKARVGNLIANIVGGALDKVSPLLADLAPALNSLAGQVADSIRTHGGAIATTLGTEFQDLAATALDAQRGALANLGESTPDNAQDAAAEAFTVAFGTGLASHGVAMAFEALFPKSLNSLDGIAPVLGEMSGFKDVAGVVLDPLYKAAFGKSLEYKYNSIFKPDFPRESDAVRWHARRLLSDADLQEVFSWSGLKAKYETAFVSSAYVPISARALASAYIDVNIPTAEVTSMMQAAGYRDADISTMLDIFNQRSTQNVRNQYLSALIAATELGDMTLDQLDAGLTSLDFSDDAKGFVHLTVATKRLQQLTTLYRKSISEGYKYGSVTDADYVTQLEAIGIQPADAQAHYAIDSITKHGKDAAATARAEATAEAKVQRAAVQAAQAQFRAGNIDAVALGAELAAAGLPAALVVYAVAVATARQNGALRLVYGQLLAPADVEVLREQVAAIGQQVYKKLLAPADAIAQLANLKVPGNIREAIVAKYAAEAALPILPA